MTNPPSPPSVSPRPVFGLEARSLQEIFWLLAIAAAGMAALLSLLPPAGHDQLWFLLMARRWLGGAPIYGPQIFDSNPPAVVWLSALPVLLARALHLPVTLAAKSLVVLAETVTSLLSFTFLRRARPAARSYELPALLFAAIVLFYVVPARDLGQRDQILSFLVLPYVLAAAVSFREHRLLLARSAAGVLAAIGICLKPHHALLPIAVELTLLVIPSWKLETGRLGTQLEPPSPNPAPHSTEITTSSRVRQLFRPEPILILLFGLAYLAAIHHFTPLYFTLALPILRDTYWAIGHLSLAGLALQALQLCILAAITITLFAIFPRIPSSRPKPRASTPTPSSRPERDGFIVARSGETPAFRDVNAAIHLHPARPRSQTVLLLIVAASAATLVYFLQGTGWYYQQLPAIALFGASLALQLLDILHHRLQAKPLRPRTWPTPAVAALCLLAVGLTTYFTGSPFTGTFGKPDRAYAPIFADPAVPDPAFFAALPPHAPVAILTTSVEAAMMPVQRFDLTWAQRTDNLWLLPAILRSESPTPGSTHPLHTLTPSRLAALDALQHRWMVEDLTRWRPTLILIARCQDPAVTCQELEDRRLQGKPGNLLAWFLRDPAFRALWSRYTYAGSRGAFDAYTLRP